MTDYEHIIISAERYALGRMTYIVDVTTKYIIKQIEENKLSKHCLLVMKNDIKDAKKLRNGNGQIQMDEIIKNIRKRGERKWLKQ